MARFSVWRGERWDFHLWPTAGRSNRANADTVVGHLKWVDGHAQEDPSFAIGFTNRATICAFWLTIYGGGFEASTDFAQAGKHLNKGTPARTAASDGDRGSRCGDAADSGLWNYSTGKGGREPVKIESL